MRRCGDRWLPHLFTCTRRGCRRRRSLIIQSFKEIKSRRTSKTRLPGNYGDAQHLSATNSLPIRRRQLILGDGTGTCVYLCVCVHISVWPGGLLRDSSLKRCFFFFCTYACCGEENQWLLIEKSKAWESKVSQREQLILFHVFIPLPLHRPRLPGQQFCLSFLLFSPLSPKPKRPAMTSHLFVVCWLWLLIFVALLQCCLFFFFSCP